MISLECLSLGDPAGSLLVEATFPPEVLKRRSCEGSGLKAFKLLLNLICFHSFLCGLLEPQGSEFIM